MEIKYRVLLQKSLILSHNITECTDTFSHAQSDNDHRLPTLIIRPFCAFDSGATSLSKSTKWPQNGAEIGTKFK